MVNQMSELNPKRHIAKTKNISSGFSISNIIKSEHSVDEAITQIKQKLEAFSNTDQPVNFEQWITYFTFDIVGRATFSRPFGFLEQGKDVGNSIAAAAIVQEYCAILGHFYWLHRYVLLENPIIKWLGLTLPTTHVVDTTLHAIASRDKDEEARGDMIEQWMVAYHKHPATMEKKEIFGVALANIGAGADTVSAALQAFIYCISKDSNRRAILQNELDHATTRGELSPVASWAQAKDLSYLNACVRHPDQHVESPWTKELTRASQIKETLRWHAPFGWALLRNVPEGGITVADRFFPEGVPLSTTVLTSVHPLTTHRQY